MSTVVASSDLRAAVRDKFNQVASAPRQPYRFRVGPSLARDVGYPAEVLDRLPWLAAAAFTGLAYLHPHLALRPGERVLDLGCGAGLDSLIAAAAVGDTGVVVGVDLAEEMVERARRVAADAGVANARFERAEAEALPFGEGEFDAVLVNGLLNLCPDKSAVLGELQRVLRRGGRAIVAEITVPPESGPVPLHSVEDWFR